MNHHYCLIHVCSTDFVGGDQSFIGGEELYDVLAAEEENRDGKNHGGHDIQIENNNTPPPLPSRCGVCIFIVNCIIMFANRYLLFNLSENAENLALK